MTALYILLGLLLFGAALWILMPISYGVPWRPTQMDRIRKALQLAELEPDEVIYDLGSGDGRVLILAAREFGARGFGIEAGVLQVLFSRLMIGLNGVTPKVRVRRGDFRQADLSEADVVFAYLTSTQAEDLQSQLGAQLRRGTRVVTIAFDLPGWQPLAFDRETLVFLYRIPPLHGDLTSFLEMQE
jgi:hypothetical protein